MFISKGVYRYYISIGNFGIKIPRYDFNNGNSLLGFISGIMMNLLERKRYKYFILNHKMKQWGNVWQNRTKDLCFCPCYFSCGLFSIYKHLRYECTWADLIENSNKSDFEEFWKEKTNWLVSDLKDVNFRKDVDGKIYCIDYGDFVLSTHRNDSVINIDYR